MLFSHKLLQIAGCLTILSLASFANDADAETPRQLVLTETYYATAKANVLREKTVVAAYHLSVLDRGEQPRGRAVQVKVKRVTVEVDVPAQNRKADFDSTDDKVDMVLPAHELIRPVSFYEQELTFTFNADGKVVSIEGLDDVERKLSGLFNRNFAGSEVVEHALDVELDRAAKERLAQSWGSLLAALILPAGQSSSPAKKAAFQFDPCVPSESWITPLKQTCPLTTTGSESAGVKTVQSKGAFKSMREVKSKMGPCDWTYQITAGTFAQTLTRDKQNRPLAAATRITAELDTTITLGDRQIPLAMSVRHEWQLKPAE